ncbi:MAG: ABC transporter permease subunit [Oscillospiraceae bacterium]|jgi:putative aldouronate transport system permease protein|nr:ABC transporter permease subunit [Oscillospiraceae bacterium]
MSSGVIINKPLYGDTSRILFYRYPRKFWVSLGGASIILFITLLNWFSTIDTYFSNETFQMTTTETSFGIFTAFFKSTGVYDLLYSRQASSGAYDPTLMLNIFRYGFPLLFLIAFAFLALAVIRYKSNSFIKFSNIGFAITAALPIVFYALIMYINAQHNAFLIEDFGAKNFFLMLINSQDTGTALAEGRARAYLADHVSIYNGLTAIPWPLIASFISILALILLRKDDKKLTIVWHQKAFFLMIIPIMIYVFIFSFLPLVGWQMSFQFFQPGEEVQPWVGFQHFDNFFTRGDFQRVMTNTLAMSMINLVLGFTTSIFLALMINEIRLKKTKRIIQTISYLPHFLSWVVAASIIEQFLMGDGILNDLMLSLGIWDERRLILAEPNSFWGMLGLSNVWKSVGWNTIIYLAAMTAIDPELYESAEIDGAGRFGKMFNITLPGIKSTILVLLIMSIGFALNAGFEAPLLLQNVMTRPTAENIDLNVFFQGIQQQNHSLATAVGMFRTLVAILLITAANQASKRFAKESLV